MPNTLVTLEAKPAPISVDVTKTAVIVVDMQNDFGAKGGMFDRAGIDLSAFQRAVGPTANVLASARGAGVKIVYLKMGFRPDLSDLGVPDSPNRVRHLQVFNVGEAIRAPDGRESRILIRDTWNTDIVPDLKPQDVLSNRPGCHPEGARYHVPHRHGVYHERMRGIDDQRCDVSRLFVRAAHGLYGRAHRTRSTKK